MVDSCDQRTPKARGGRVDRCTRPCRGEAGGRRRGRFSQMPLSDPLEVGIPGGKRCPIVSCAWDGWSVVLRSWP